MRKQTIRTADLSDQAYVELVRSLFALLLPSIVMSILFIGLAILAAWVTGDPGLLILGLIGSVLSAVRIGVVLFIRRRIEQRIADRHSAGSCERLYAVPYVGFAMVLGLFSARVMTLPNVGLHMVSAAVLVGYAAGVAATISLRPRLGAASMALAVLPTVVACVWQFELFSVALSVVYLALLTGGLQSMRVRYLTEVDKIELRRSISGLARRDPLTELPNRLGLDESFDEIAQGQAADCLVAVHCIDLDRFKPVNDCFGHPVGDEVLRMVAARLNGGLRQGDLAARVGGDEFVVLQCTMQHPDEAELLARRLIRVLGEPYVIEGQTISIGASVGYAVSRCDETLKDLTAKADVALYAIKSGGGGAAARCDTKVGTTLSAA